MTPRKRALIEFTGVIATMLFILSAMQAGFALDFSDKPLQFWIPAIFAYINARTMINCQEAVKQLDETKRK